MAEEAGMKSGFLEGIFLKLSALALAVVAYFYVSAELKESPGTLPSALIKDYAVKSVPIRVDLLGRPPRGFQIQEKQIVVEPKQVMIVGPDHLINPLDYLETQPIYIGGRTGEVKARIGLKVTRGIRRMEQEMVDVVIPIEREQ